MKKPPAIGGEPMSALPIPLTVPSNLEQAFQGAITAAGLTPPDTIIADGKIHRFSTNGKRSDNAGWYILHLDNIPAGSFGNWREGRSESWCSIDRNAQSPKQEKQYAALLKSMQNARHWAKKAEHDEAAEMAQTIWASATLIDDAAAHGYLVKKGIQPYGAKLIDTAAARAYCAKLSYSLFGQLLVIPMRNATGELRSLQFINEGGTTKRPLTGGEKQGCHYRIDKPDSATHGGILIVCEGFATGASIHEATGQPVAVAFDSGNLEPVAKSLRKLYPDATLIIAADDDYCTEGNPGRTAAAGAAKAVGGIVVSPMFPTDRPNEATDFNDLHQLAGGGLDAVKVCFAAAIEFLAGRASHKGPGSYIYAEPMQTVASAHTVTEGTESIGNFDANDLAQSKGKEALRAILQSAQEPTLPLPMLKPVSVSDVLTNPAPPPQFVWDGYLPRGVVSLLGAHGGTGKSTIALMLSVCAALGRPLFGVDTVQCKTLFVSLEDSAHIVRHRLAFICHTWGINPALLDGKLHIVDGTENPELFSAESRGAGETTATYFELRKLVQSEGVGLVVIDNASDAYGGDEIQRKQVRLFIRSLVMVARLTDSAVALLAHVDKTTARYKKADGDEGYSGSTAWHNSVRSRLFMTRKDNGLLKLEHQKSNLGKKREVLELEWWADGLPQLTSNGTANNSLDPFMQRIEGRADDECAISLLRMIAEFESRQQYCSTAITSRNHVHAMLKSERAFSKLKLGLDDTKRIVNQCQRAKWLEPMDYRTPDRKPHQRWTLTHEGRLIAGLIAPSAPTAPTTEDGASLHMAQAGAPTAPTGVGGMGERVHTQDGATKISKESSWNGNNESL